MSDQPALQEAVTAALQSVVDPNANRDVVSLGYVRRVGLSGSDARVVYELPSELMSPDSQAQLKTLTQEALAPVQGVENVVVEFQPKPPPRATSNLPGVKHVVAVGAGKGGVGKSTVAILLAVGLQRAGHRVGLLDADVYGPSLPKLSGTEALHPVADPDTGRIHPPEFSGIKIMSMGYLVPPNQAVVWRGPMAQKYVKEFLDRGIWGELDYLIVDLPPGTGDVPLTLAQSIPLTGAVVVCTPQDVALLDATKAVRMYQKLEVEPLGMVENMSTYVCTKCGHTEHIFGHGGAREAADALQIPFLGEVPINIGIRVAGDDGTPFEIFNTAPPELVGALDHLVKRVREEVERKARRRTPLPQLNISG
jgi:ATP-binding protein involved in chromosome partitioning